MQNNRADIEELVLEYSMARISIAEEEEEEEEASIVVSIKDITERERAKEELDKKLDELQRWYNATLDREGRNLELKHEVNELLRRLKEPIRYPSAEA